MKFYSIIMALILSFGLLGCSDELGKDEGSDTELHTNALVPQFKVTTTGEAEPNRYSVLIEWPDASGTVRISESSKILAVVPGVDQKYLHAKVPGGHNAAYLFEQLSADGRVLASIPLYVGVPADVVISQDTTLKEATTIEAERVFLRSAIYTHDKSLYITAKEVISDNALIRNFPADSKAGREKTGRAGGSINIVAKRSRGNLRVYLNGENGGDGKNGSITVKGRHPGCPGSSGGQGGKAGNLNVDISEDSDMSISYENVAAPGGLAGKKNSVPMTTPATEAIHPPCHKDAVNGVDGQVGVKGKVCLKLAPSPKFICSE
ncbi:hypothetical protein [Bdellovibrio bacteriovorus]|uniref:hypothetical protein n=1 Tax=Bdellovibrio bacteriovorus TaxID=959 RepID=UPI003AA7AE86